MADKQDWKTVAMVMDHSSRVGSNPAISNQVTEFAREYANGKKRTAAGVSSILDFGGPSGSSIPSVLAQNSAISSLLYTMSRADKLQLFRYFNRHDPMVGRAIDLHTELPMSRVTIGPPKGPSPRQNKEITRIYESMCDDIDLMSLLLDIPRELWLIGDVYVWIHWDSELLTIDEAYVLPAEYMHSIIHPFNRKKEIIFFAKPLVDTAAIRRITDRDLYLVADTDIERLYESLGDSIPEELKEALNYGEAVPLNTNWRRGSFCAHIARDRPPNEEYGVSLIERNMDTLLRLENLKNANFQISSRNMAPKYVISAPGIGKEALAELRTQFDLALLETADYPIITNYEVNVQVLGANDRLLNTESEYNILRQDLAMGLGSTVDMLTGASTYGGQRITLETMNTQYLRLRDNMKTFVEKSVFLPVAFAKGHYMEEEIEMWPRVKPEDTEVGDILIEERNGHLRRKRTQINTIWMYSTLRFNRVSIRDNAEVYDQLFQLYQKGSLAVRYLLDLHNIDPEENSQALLEDLGTPKDSVFNDFTRALYTSTDVPQKVVNQTDFIDRIIQGMKLIRKPQGAGAGAAGGGMGGGGMGGGMSDMGGLGGAMGGLGGMPGEAGMGPEGAPGGMPGAEGAGGAPGAPGAAPGAPPEAAPTPTASRRRASKQAAEALPAPLPGRVLAPDVAEKLRGVVSSKYNQGIDLSPRDVKREIHKIEVEKQRADHVVSSSNGTNGTGHKRVPKRR